MKTNEIPVIIPSYEPDDRLTALLVSLVNKGIRNIVLVNDGSSAQYDCYFECAEHEFGCTVLRHAVNQGKGRALKTAFNYCLLRWPEAPGCVTADSDGQHSPECILNCMQTLYKYPQNLVLGVRDFSDEQVPFNSRWGNRITCAVFRLLCGVYISDTQTGLRGIPSAFMKQLLGVPGERFEFETNMLVETRNRYPVVEVPIKTIYDSRVCHTTHFNPFRDSFRIYAVFLKFLLSSLSSTAVDLGAFQVFVWLLKGFSGEWYIAASTFFARLLSAMVNFRCNQKLVFKSKAGTARSALRYTMLCLAQTAISACLVTTLYGAWGGSEVVVKIIVDSVLFFISFQIQRLFVFSMPKN